MKKEYKETILQEINNLHHRNPQKYWKLVKGLKNMCTENKDCSEKVSSTDWYDYFKELFKPHNAEVFDFDKELKDNMAKLKAENVFDELNFTIKEEDVNTVAVGLDNIFK